MRQTARKLAFGLLLTAALLMLVGCLDYEEQLTYTDMTSGSVSMKYSVDRIYLDQMLEMYKGMGQSMAGMEVPDKATDMMFKRDDIETSLARFDGRVKLTTYDVSETDKSYVWNIGFSFTDLDNLGPLYNAVSSESDMPEEEYVPGEQPWLTKQADGTLLFLRPLDGNDEEAVESDEYDDNDVQGDDEGSAEDDNQGGDKDEGGPPDETTAEGMGQITDAMSDMAEGMGDHQFVFQVTFPGEIVESNATSVDGNTATWVYQMKDFESTPEPQRAVIKP